MSHKTAIDEPHWEGTTPLLEFDIQDEAEVGFKPTELFFTLYDGKTDTIVNDRNNVSVIDSCDANGHVALWMEADDLAMLNTNRRTEVRRALFRWTWNAGQRTGSHEVEFTIENNVFLPAAP